MKRDWFSSLIWFTSGVLCTVAVALILWTRWFAGVLFLISSFLVSQLEDQK